MFGLVLYMLLCFIVSVVTAETGIDAWLRYEPLSNMEQSQDQVPGHIIALNNGSSTSPVYTAGFELQRGLSSIFSQNISVEYNAHGGCSLSTPSVTVGTIGAFKTRLCQGDESYYKSISEQLEPDGFWLSVENGSNVTIIGQNERGALYGAFEYLSMMAQGNFTNVSYATNPNQSIRWVNQWDNMDGSIERGYGGPSIFFANYSIVENLSRVEQYARLLASIRINGIVVNNVNANETLLTDENIQGLARIADAMRPWGIPIGISLNFAAPKELGALDTFDPLDQKVIDWWKERTDAIYKAIPDMCGYLAKGDAEGREGPMTYNRTLDQGARVFSKALKPYNGVLMYRAFVYDEHLDYNDWHADRANAAYDIFEPLDGKFDDNVIVQIKNGPIDFQVREAVHPLFGALRNTSVAIEVEVTQEYLGQQCHLVYQAPSWSETLNFDIRTDNQTTLISDVVSGKRFHRPLGGSAGVVNVGTNKTWLGSHLSLSNLYSYGKLCWNPQDDPEEIVKEWTRLTFGIHDQQVVDTITHMSMESWPAYENYTGNLGLQTLTDILYTRFGPNPYHAEHNGWGQWTRTYHENIGMDRTVSNGTGYSGRYPSELASMYENVSTTPDNLLLWFHHVNYTHRLNNGKTVIQHLYDAHYSGAEKAQEFLKLWESLEGKIDDERFKDTLFRQTFQAGHALVWRDVLVDYYYNATSINDELGRVGNHPWRLEAEAMYLDGYKLYSVHPSEMASNSTAIVTTSNSTSGVASAAVPFEDGIYDISVNYYDMFDGKAHWKLDLNGKEIGAWMGDNEDHLGHEQSRMLDAHTATRRTFKDLSVRRGDIIKIRGTPNGLEPAPIDYISFLPKGIID